MESLFFLRHKLLNSLPKEFKSIKTRASFKSVVVLQNLLSVFSTKSSQKPLVSSSFPSSFRWRSFHLLQIISRTLFSGDQGYYSSSSEACQDHQKLKSFTPFPSFTAYFTNSISQIIIHPKNRLNGLTSAFYETSCLPLAFLNLTTCHLSNLRSINLI